MSSSTRGVLCQRLDARDHHVIRMIICQHRNASGSPRLRPVQGSIYDPISLGYDLLDLPPQRLDGWQKINSRCTKLTLRHGKAKRLSFDLHVICHLPPCQVFDCPGNSRLPAVSRAIRFRSVCKFFDLLTTQGIAGPHATDVEIISYDASVSSKLDNVAAA